MTKNNNNKLAIINQTNTNNNDNKGGRKMKNKKMKTRIIAGMLSMIAVFSVGTASVTTVSAAEAPGVTGIAKDLSSFAITQTIDKFVSNSIAGSLLKMGTGYLLDWVFSGKEEKQPTVKDAIEEIGKLRDTVNANHKEEMNSLKVINSNIDTKDFRLEADSIRDDYSNALTMIKRHSDNITRSGEGVIDDKTYGAYKAILAESSCNIASLEKNFNKMKEYVLGERHSTDKKSAYETTTDYLYKKVMEGYKETHNWKDSTDFLKIVKKDINGEISSIHFEAEVDYLTMLVLNNMAYKVREYEVQKGIYKPAEGEKPYAYYQNFETDLSTAMGKFNDAYKKVIDANNKDGKMVQAVVTLAEPVDGIQEKGFRSFAEAWAQASSTNKNFTIELRDDIKSVKDKSFNVDGLDKDKYGFTPGGNFHVKDGRTITVDLGGYTIDNTACSNLSTFGFESNSTLIINNGTIKGGENALRADGRTKVHIKADKLTVTDTAWAGIYMGVHSIGVHNAKEMKLEMTNCTVKNAKQESGLRVLPYDSQITLTNCTFENNNSTYSGGAIYTDTTNEAVIKDCTFKNNKANNGVGGAIAANGVNVTGSKLKVTGGLFEGNVSNKTIVDRYVRTPEDLKKGAGGAIACDNLTADGVTFKNNSSNDQAGAIFIGPGMSYDRSYFKNSITNCTFEGNKADHVGGAIRLFHIDDRNVIKNCKFTDNFANNRVSNILVQYGHGLGDKLAKEWGNTSNAMKYNNNANGVSVVNK